MLGCRTKVARWIHGRAIANQTAMVTRVLQSRTFRKALQINESESQQHFLPFFLLRLFIVNVNTKEIGRNDPSLIQILQLHERTTFKKSITLFPQVASLVPLALPNCVSLTPSLFIFCKPRKEEKSRETFQLLASLSLSLSEHIRHSTKCSVF